MAPAYANLPLHAVLGALSHLGFWGQVAISLALLSFGMVIGVAVTLYRLQNARSFDQSVTMRRQQDGVIWLASYRQNPALKRTRTKSK